MRRRLNATLLLGVSLCMGAGFEAPVVEPDEFHFVVLGDAQFHNPAQFNRIIDQTRRLGPAFVIQVGDLIEGYNNDLDTIKQEWQRFGDQVAPLAPAAFYAVPGNHDVYNGERQVDPRLERLFEQIWGPLHYAFTYKNALLVTLNSDSSDGANQIAGKQLAWLQQTLQDSDAAHKFVFLHRPPMLTQNAAELHAVFKRHGVTHVFYGHHHHYHFFERDGIAYTMTNAAANSVHDHEAVGGFHHLLQVSVRGSQVEVAVIKADAIKPQNAVEPIDNYDFFELNRRLAPRQVGLAETGARAYELTVPLKNTSRRDLQILVSCTSADQRWQFTPRAIDPIPLASQDTAELVVKLSYAANRVPESQPVCTLRVPFQTGHGEWLEYEQTVTASRPTG